MPLVLFTKYYYINNYTIFTQYCITIQVSLRTISYLCVVAVELSSSWDVCLSTEGDHLRNGLVKDENGPVERCEPLLEVDAVPLPVASCSAIVGTFWRAALILNFVHNRRHGACYPAWNIKFYRKNTHVSTS